MSVMLAAVVTEVTIVGTAETAVAVAANETISRVGEFCLVISATLPGCLKEVLVSVVAAFVKP